MSKVKNIIRGGVLSLGMAALVVAPTFAACDPGKVYDGVKFQNSSVSTASGDFKVKCSGATFSVNNQTYQAWGKTTADCSRASSLISDPECGAGDLNSIIQTIINTIIFAIGIVAVFMVILGGIQYTTSQGDAGKVKKAKDTIMYGVIGLVVALLAFAIVNFVLTSIF